ncbi:triose-phosphate isomerase [Jatrophihabitans telluris]|uniref:Triosephosphate isomerase n=2 Tax=Jatrophihabitans telluris TaxID=2038343 RepID=A0ABY4R459_9ACTN|nr:triose-phosphate isomerase [Jatrophihabitans telluris]UQX90172.1 triose-phosphate isomerase [Jatrophihabitans telluris]
MAKPVRKPLIAGNWKMNLSHLEAIALVQKIAFSLKPQHYDAVDVTVLPAFTSIRSVQSLIDGDKLRLSYGAQDLSPHASGAYTGDVSGPMLAKLGCSFVTVGHSERRQYHEESDELVNRKLRAALTCGMTPILCVGEGIDVREAGDHVEHCSTQLSEGLSGLSEEQVDQVVLAYEPIWAIGTGKVATPADAQEVCRALRSALSERHGADLANRTRILYGGSVKANNAGDLLAQPDLDGALVGGASLDATEFAGICVAAAGGPFGG